MIMGVRVYCCVLKFYLPLCLSKILGRTLVCQYFLLLHVIAEFQAQDFHNPPLHVV